MLRYRIFNIYLSLVVLILTHAGVKGSSVISIAPDSEVAVLGSKVRFSCNVETDKLVIWTHMAVGSNTKSLVYSGYALNASLNNTHEVINRTAGHWDLIIKLVQLSDAGTYFCKQPDKAEATANLIVLKSDLHCQSKSESVSGFWNEGNDIRFQCDMEYRGSSEPRLNCRVEEHPDLELTLSNIPQPNALVRYTVSTTATKELNTCKIKCSVNTSSANSPWISDAIQVSYGPHAVTIEPHQELYKDGDKLKCSAESNPPATYQWTDLDTNSQQPNGNELTLVQTDGVTAFRYRCTATNPESHKSLGGEISASLAIPEPSDPHLIAVYVAGAASGATAILAIIIVLVVKCSRRQRPARQDKPGEKIEQTEVVYAVVDHGHGRSAPDLLHNTDSLPRSHYANTLDLGCPTVYDNISCSPNVKSAAIPDPAIYARVKKSDSVESNNHLSIVALAYQPEMKCSNGSMCIVGKVGGSGIFKTTDSISSIQNQPGMPELNAANNIYIVDNGFINNDQVYELEKPPPQSVYEFEDKCSTGSSRQMEDMKTAVQAGDGTLYAQLDLSKYPTTPRRTPVVKYSEGSAYAEIDYTLSSQMKYRLDHI